MATCLSWTKPSEQPLHFIWRAKRTLHSRLFSRATLMWSHDPSPPLNSNGELARGCLRWIMKLNDHKNEFCHFLNTKRALSRSLPTNGIWTESFWSTQDSLVEDIRNASGMPPYLKVSYTNLSPKVQCTNSAAWPILYACAQPHQTSSNSQGQLLFSCFGEEETENEFSTSI